MLYASALLEPSKNLKCRMEKGKNRFEQKWRMGFTASLMYWPFVNSVMYAYIKPKFYNIYADCFTIIFAAIMSYIVYNNRYDIHSGKINNSRPMPETTMQRTHINAVPKVPSLLVAA